MKKPRKSHPVSLRLSETVIRKLEHGAKQNEMTKTGFITHLIVQATKNISVPRTKREPKTEDVFG